MRLKRYGRPARVAGQKLGRFAIRKSRLIILSAALFAFGFIAGLAFAHWAPFTRTPSPLTSNLPSEWNAASAQFDERIKVRFPPGTAVSELIGQLKIQGFEPAWSENGGEESALRNEGNFACNVAARVYWRAEKDGTVSSVRGVYREEGCL